MMAKKSNGAGGKEHTNHNLVGLKSQLIRHDNHECKTTVIRHESRGASRNVSEANGKAKNSQRDDRANYRIDQRNDCGDESQRKQAVTAQEDENDGADANERRHDIHRVDQIELLQCLERSGEDSNGKTYRHRSAENL